MSRITLKKYPPYMGNDPYIFLCFSQRDTAAVLPLIKRLAERRVRFYYVHGTGKDAREASRIQQRIRDAGAMFFLATDHTAEDGSQKGFGQYFESLCGTGSQNYGQKHITVIRYGNRDAQMLDYGLSRLPESIYVGSDPAGELAESAVIRAKGFTSDFIGEEIAPSYKKIFLFLFAVVLLSTVAAVACLCVQKQQAEKHAALQAERLPITDTVIASAAELAASDLGFDIPTADNVSFIETLVLESVPEKPEELALFVNLKCLSVPQEIAGEIWDLTEGRYEIRLIVAGEEHVFVTDRGKS